jgi:protein-S-isoprenylcysteine O-methyltransferase Ste14
MPRLALAVYVVFLAIAFGWRSWVQYRRTGDVGFRGFSRGVSGLERAVGTLFAVALVACLAAIVAALRGGLAPLAALDGDAAQALGLVLALAGIAVTVVARMQMGDSWRIGVDERERTTLVRRGLFDRVRNPIFTGMLLATLGLVFLVPNLLAALAWLVLLVAVELQVRRVEEPYLLRAHGASYADHARSLGRFVHGIGRIS